MLVHDSSADRIELAPARPEHHHGEIGDWWKARATRRFPRRCARGAVHAPGGAGPPRRRARLAFSGTLHHLALLVFRVAAGVVLDTFDPGRS